jgi:hypothetical protein
MYPVWKPRVGIREDTAVCQEFLVHNVIRVDRGRSRIVGRELLGAGVGNVGRLEVWRELKTVRLHKAVSNYLHDSSQRFEAVDHLRDRGRGLEVLEEAVGGVYKPEVAGAIMLLYVVHACEVVTEEGADQGLYMLVLVVLAWCPVLFLGFLGRTLYPFAGHG